MAEAGDRTGGRLEESIVEARRVLITYDWYLRGNETATRTLVIDEVLNALGWNVKDPARVRLEHRANGNKMDYVLVSSANGFLAVVEAKSGDSGLREADRRQASGYAVEIGARYAVLTNGGRWEAWEMVQRRPRKDSVIAEVHVTTGEIADIAETLGKLRRDVLEG